jgi:diguanylate cyclase (GGDEF)-like protein
MGCSGMVASLDVTDRLVGWPVDGNNLDRRRLDSRQQRVVLCPLVFGPVVLRPLVVGRLVLGPVVFGPVVFGPVVFGPVVFGPVVFGPVVFGPVVLGRVVLRLVVRVLDTVTGLSARVRTLALSFVLGSIAVAGALYSALSAGEVMSRPVVAVAIAVTFFVAEQNLVNVEFRRQSHSLTFAGVPLALGILLLPVHEVVLARLVGSLAALLWQRIAAEKVIYNTAAFCFEVAVSGTLLHAWLLQTGELDLRALAVLLVCIAAVDQLMSILVLWVIHMHGGTIARSDFAEVLVPAVMLSLVATVLAAALQILIRQGIVGDLLALALVIVAVFIYRMYASTSRRHQSLAVVHDFVTEGVGAETVEQLAPPSLARMRHVLRATAVELRLLDSNVDGQQPSKETYLFLGLGEDDQLTHTDTHTAQSTDWVHSKAIHHGEPTLATRGRDTAVVRWLASRNLKDAIVVPLQSGANILGTVTVTDRLGDTATFTDDDLKMLQTLTSHFAVAVSSARLFERLSYEATHDALTGLANRAHLSRQIRASASVSPGSAVLLLDVDKFKEVNDILGHDVGDQLLIVIAERLSACMPEDATVARLGGDEFAVLLPGGADGIPDVTGLAELAADRILAPVWFSEALLTPEVSIGIATSPTVVAENLLRCADTAMYVAKSRSESVAVYETSMDSGRAERLALVADMRVALDHSPQQFALHYQPKIDLATGAVVSAEALVRWNHPTLGTLAPDRFIPLAEATGLIDQLTMHLITAALSECATWRRRGHAVTVAVNLSARNLANATVIRHIADAITATGAQAEWLILEITESSVMEDPEEAVAALNKIAELGICLSLDDFGTGYSSLSYLQRLPVTELKIDRSFVSGLTEHDPAGSAAALFRSITALGANLSMRIVAEGIETKAQLDAVAALGCQVGQGYLIARPMAVTLFQTWLDDYPSGRKELRLVPDSA